MPQFLVGKRLGEYLKKARKKAGLTLREVESISARLAPNDTLKIHYAYLSKLERGLYERPSTEKLIVLAVIYGLDHRELLTRVGFETKSVHRAPEVLQAISDFVASSMRGIPTLVGDFLSSAMPKRPKLPMPSLSAMWQFLEEARKISERLGNILRKSIALYWEGNEEKIALLEAFLNQLTTPESLKAADEQVEALKRSLEAARRRTRKEKPRRKGSSSGGGKGR